jgi:uncharacterized alpha-E superfamily protein
VISRVAESCFWLNRYVERVETHSRMLSVNHAFQLDVAIADAERWRPLVVVTGEEEDFLERTDASKLDDSETVQAYLTWSEDNPSSLHSSLRFARENARTIRETISLEMWEVLNDLWVWMNDRAARRMYRSDRHAFYLRLRNQCLLFHGAAHATMLHEDPFEFMRLGTALERAGQTARVLDIKHHSIGPTDAREESPAEGAQWIATLRYCSGAEPFVKRESQILSGRTVAEFLLFDRSFARSVLHNLIRARNFLGLVRPPGRDSSLGATTDAYLVETLGELEALDIDRVLERGLHEVLTGIVEATARICESVRREFFDPAISHESQSQTDPQTDPQTDEGSVVSQRQSQSSAG